jgi:hypothetical protein
MESSTRLVALTVLGLATISCDRKEAPPASAEPAAAAPAAASAPGKGEGASPIVPAPEASAKSAASSEPPPATEVVVDESRIDRSLPDIPGERSKPPTVSEWKDAPEVNSQGKSSRPDGCFMKVRREWLKVNCSGLVHEVADLTGFGKEGVDYFTFVTPQKSADVVVRLVPGQALSMRMVRAEGDALLFTHWPKDRPKPNVIALGEGAYPTYGSCGG